MLAVANDQCPLARPVSDYELESHVRRVGGDERDRAEASFGSIEPNKSADLVLLAANPLSHIRNVDKIQAVFARGRLFDRAALDQMLKQVEAAAKRQT